MNPQINFTMKNKSIFTMKKILVFLTLTLVSLLHAQIEANQLESKIFNKVVSYKKKLTNWKPFVVDTSMSNSCRSHSVYMASIDDLQHIETFDGVKGKSEIIQYASCYGEGCDSDKMAERILNNFLKSPPHKANIDATSTEIGIGVYVQTQKNIIESPFSTETYITQTFWITIRFY